MEREGKLGVRTARGDFERSLVADVLRELQAAGVHDLSAPSGCLALVALEDRARLVGGLVGVMRITDKTSHGA